MWSSVEKSFLQRSGRQLSYKGENIPIIEVGNIYELGKIVALRFIEWIAANPEGVIALPTGKTPEYFIKTLERYRLNWSHAEVIQEREGYGLSPSIADFPDTSRLHFVMLDEFFPMLPTHRNAFVNYVRTFYTSPLGIKNENILDFNLLSHGVITEEDMNQFEKIVDLSLLTRDAKNEKEKIQKEILVKVQAYCDEYEKKIRDLGGIGFFLGGIGPDGHIAFNQEGSDHESTTRLVPFNYPSAAAAAGDLGGIEIARGKAAVTIGLGTITWKQDATVIIMAAGEGKATVVREAIELEPSPARPASVLQRLAGARFYITHGAAMKLTMRKQEKVQLVDESCLKWALNHLSGNVRSTSPYMIQPPADYLLLESGIYDASLKVKIPVHKLGLREIHNIRHLIELPKWMLDNELAFQIICSCASRRLKEKINGGIIESSPVGKKILHTAPHHDDIMLSYHCAMHEMLGRQPVAGFDNFSHFLHQRNRGGVGGGSIGGNQSLMELTSSPARGHIRQHSGNSHTFSAFQSQMLGERYNQNLNHFAYLTSGFHSVNEDFLRNKVNTCLSIEGKNGQLFVEEAVHTGQLTREYDDLMCLFREAFFERKTHLQDYIENIIFLRKVAEVWKIEVRESYSKLILNLKEKLFWIQNEYLPHHQPGDAIPREIQLLKGCMRESEVDRVWALSSMPNNRIHHMRSKFYTDDFFTPMPSLEDDALPMANLIKSRQPDILTVAFDPEGTGPDTHYKVLQVVAAGLRISLSREDLDNPDVLVWGYRNVWFVFPPSQATLMIPCSEEDLTLMHDTFMSCFTTQKNASFPSPYYDGPFSAWARQIQYEQRQMLEILLGEEFFQSHKNPKVRNSKGFIFIQAMDAVTFLNEVQELKSKFENVISAAH